jgi:hypothetical protein
MKRQFGPLTIGTSLGAGIGLAIGLYGLYAIRQGSVQRSHDSVALIAFGAAVLGGGLGVFAEHLIRRPAFAKRIWIRHVIRPVAFCTLPYLVVAASMAYFGDDRLMRGVGFLLCVVVLPSAGLVLAWRRSTRPEFNREFTAQDELPDNKSLDRSDRSGGNQVER